MGNSLYLTSASIQELHIHQTTHPPLIHTTHEDYGIDYCNGDDDGNDDNGGVNDGVNDGGSNNGDDKKMMALVIMMVVMMKLMTMILIITTLILMKKMMILMILFRGIAYSSNHTATSHSQHHPLTIQFLGC